ncbi:hypothetical protein SDC9_148159 [bioreactor metagenome]|uniref:Uncharacterized protein n=1 Tax=bioreactor metagenome TaxID=1076179 RepID=A0A645EGB9_9ZZZZ
MEFLNESNGYITVACKCGQIIKKHKNYCKQYGDEYHFNPPITCVCGNTESIACKKVIDNPDPSKSYSSPQEIGRELKKAYVKSLPLAKKIFLGAGFAFDELKEEVNEGVQENVRKTPVYKLGAFEGEKKGYTKASKEYEDKLLKQALMFEEQKVSNKENGEELKKLLDKYEKYIEKLEAELGQLSDVQQKRVEELKKHYEKLLKIKHLKEN